MVFIIIFHECPFWPLSTQLVKVKHNWKCYNWFQNKAKDKQMDYKTQKVVSPPYVSIIRKLLLSTGLQANGSHLLTIRFCAKFQSSSHSPCTSLAPSSQCCKLSLFQTYVYLLPNKILLGGNVLSYLLSEKHVDQRLFLILSEKHVNAIRLLTYVAFITTAISFLFFSS